MHKSCFAKFTRKPARFTHLLKPLQFSQVPHRCAKNTFWNLLKMKIPTIQKRWPHCDLSNHCPANGFTLRQILETRIPDKPSLSSTSGFCDFEISLSTRGAPDQARKLSLFPTIQLRSQHDVMSCSADSIHAQTIF